MECYMQEPFIGRWEKVMKWRRGKGNEDTEQDGNFREGTNVYTRGLGKIQQEVNRNEMEDYREEMQEGKGIHIRRRGIMNRKRSGIEVCKGLRDVTRNGSEML